MNFKKIMSGLLSFAAVASVIPGSIVSAAEDNSFTNSWGDVIRKEDCLYYEDFENSDGTDFDIAPEITAKGYWHNEIASKDGNRAMRYYATPKANGVKFDANDGKSLINSREILVETDKINDDGWYEVGYSLYPDDMKGFVKSSLFSVKLAGVTSLNVHSHNASNPDWISWGGDLIAQVDGLRNGYPIEIKAVIDTNTGKINVHCRQNGKNVGWNKRESFPKTVSYKNIKSGNASITFGISSAPSVDSLTVDEPGFRIDNFYIKKLPSYKVEFNKNDGSGEIVSKQTISPAAVYTEPKPTRDGYQFDGWYTEPECINEFDKDAHTEDLTVYAKWLKIHTITFESDGGTKIDPIQTITDEITMPDDPIKFRYEFGGWFTDETYTTEFDGTGISGDMTIYAKWTYANEIKFVTNGGEEIDPIYTVSGVDTVPDAVRTGYRFDGWFTDEELTKDFDCTNVTEDVTVYAKWTRKHVISFETFGGEPVDVVYTLEDVDVDKLPKAVKPGFGFEGWFIDKDLTTEFDGKNITEDITLYAKYSNVIYHEDFENNYDNEWLKQLAPNKWEQWAGEGYGVVEDKSGNHEFRVAAESGKTLKVEFPNGGAGLYEIEFKVRSETAGNFLMQPFMAPAYNGRSIVSASVNGGWTGFNGQLMHLQLLNGGSDVKGYITYKWRIDTVNKKTQMLGEYTNKVNRVIRDVGTRRDYTYDANGVTGVNLGIGVNTDARMAVYIDDVYVRKIEQPRMVSSTPSSGTVDTELRPEITLSFDRKLDSTTITTSSITISDENGKALSADDYTMADSVVDGNTEIKIRLKKDLEYATTYTVNVSSDLQDMDGYYLSNSYKVEFTTKPVRYEVAPSLVDRNGDTVNDITTYKGKTVNAKLYVRNFAGDENDDLFVSAALVDDATGRQISYSFDEVTVAKGEGKEVINAEFAVPEEVTANYKVHYYIWNSRGERKALTDSCVLPQ